MTESADTWTVRRVLEWTSGFFTRKAVDAPRLSAELLLAHTLSVPRIKLYTDYERPLSAKDLGDFRGLVQRAAEHEPIAYLTGKAHFFNLELEVSRDVLIPRPDTETLVEQVVQLCRHQSGLESPRILDLCTGSGCVAVALAKNIKAASVVATDVSAPALEVARRNIAKLGLADRVVLEQGDLFDAVRKMVDARPFDLIVANPPYVPTGQIDQLDRNVREFEPRIALDGGPDGLGAHRRILAEAPAHLVAVGRIFVEIQFDQAQKAQAITAESGGWEDVRIVKDITGNDRLLTARRKMQS